MVLLLIPTALFAQQDWVLKKSKDGIQVFMKEVAGSPFKEVRVKLKCTGSLQKFQSLVLDVNNHKKWVYNTKESDLLKPISADEMVYYTEIFLPWPVSNRDLTCHLKLVKDSIPNTYFLKAHAVEGVLPPKDGRVRVTSSNSFWKVVQLENDALDIEYTIRVDPAGSIPPWLVNATAVTGPFNSFTNLKQLLAK